MTTVHKNLTGADLHEPKGADTAVAGCVYVSDGAGSGTWVAASSVITNTAFSTGDLKPTHKTTADSGWILWSDGSIGDGSSGATIRANSDTSALYTLYWNGYSNTLCPVSSGRGASAAADFAAHKTLTLPVGAGRAIALAGTGSGLTARTLGQSYGAETVPLVSGNMPQQTFTPTVASFNLSTIVQGVVAGYTQTANTALIGSSNTTAFNLAVSGSITMNSTTIGNASPTGVAVSQASTPVNIMIKL